MTIAVIPELSQAPVRLELMRRFALTHLGLRVALPLSAQRLLAYVALQKRPVLRAKVASILWLEGTDERCCANLRSALWRLRRPGCALVEAVGSALRVSPEVAVDVHEAEARARRLLDGAPETVAADDLRVDRDDLGADLLPDWYDDWVLVERERLHELRMHALEALAQRLAPLGRYAEAVEAALAAVRAEPLRESAHRVLIGVHLAEGNRHRALCQYREYTRVMRAELDLEPSPEIAQMVAHLMH
jgi:DNA-binding SARP family transcriptional activator